MSAKRIELSEDDTLVRAVRAADAASVDLRVGAVVEFDNDDENPEFAFFAATPPDREREPDDDVERGRARRKLPSKRRN